MKFIGLLLDLTGTPSPVTQIWLARPAGRSTTPPVKNEPAEVIPAHSIRRMQTGFKRLLPLLLLLALPAVARAQFAYAVSNGTVTITRYIGGAGPVTIPNTIAGLPVTAIGDAAFSACAGVTSVALPASLTSIGSAAFERCTGLSDITIPGGVTNIGNGAFDFCSELSTITVAPPAVAYSSAGGVLFDHTQTALIRYPPGRAGAYAVPANVTNIADYAFYSCSRLTGFTVPGSLSRIGYGAFRLCGSLTNVTLAGGLSLGGTAFADCIGLTDITVPQTITNIGAYAFANCTSLSNAYFLGDAPAVGASVFLGDVNATVYYWSTNTGWTSVFAGRPAVPWDPVIASQPPLNLFLCPGDSCSLSVTAKGKPPLGYQWRKNGTNLTDTLTCFGSTAPRLTLSNLTEVDLAHYDVVVTNSAGSTTSVVAALAFSAAPAHATPVVVNGFIVGSNLLDGGCGYTNSPIVTFVGPSGSGATGYGQISNGSVTNIVITGAGLGYSAKTTLLVGPPFYPVLILDTPELTMPSASATAMVVNGFIVGATVTAPGALYDTPPDVAFTDSSGYGAAASAQISNGSVTGIVITAAGFGYSSNATITIAAPPEMKTVTISARDLMAGQAYQLQNGTNVSSGTNVSYWVPVGTPFSPTQSSQGLITNSWSAVTNAGAAFFRLELVP